MATSPTTDIRNIISSKSKELSNILSSDFRKELDRRTHILDLSFEALKVNVYQGESVSKAQLSAYKIIYDKLVAAVLAGVSKSRTFKSLLDVPKGMLEDNKGVVLIYSGINDIFIVGVSFDAVRKFVSSKVSSSPDLVRSRFGTLVQFQQKLDAKDRPIPGDFKRVTKSKLDIGHIPSEGSTQLTSPLEQKFLATLDFGIKAKNTGVVNAAKMALEELYHIQAKFQYSFKNTTPEAIDRAKKTLGEAYIVVTLQTSKKNNEFSNKEAAIYFKLLKNIANSVDPLSIAGSNTIFEDIRQGIIFAITGKNRPKKHVTRVGTTSVSIRPKNKMSTGVTRVSVPKDRSDVDTPIASLQVLLNQQLAAQIQKNMGSGKDSRVLNYRTGRLADSARVDRISESREGMITAFYSYMKNPYATFSTGGQQQYPKTRDPKLLISRSIREIGQSLAYTRMRAVNV